MAKLIKEHTRTTRVLWGNKQVFARVWIEEYATTWRISAKIFGHACLSAEQWKYTKKECKSIEDLLLHFVADFNKHWN